MKTNFFKKLSLFILGGAMALGVGVGVASGKGVGEVKAAEEVQATLSATSLGLGSYSDNSTGDYYWTQLMKGSSNTIQGNSSKSSVLYNHTAFSYAITKIKVTIGNAAGKNSTASLYFGSSENPTSNEVKMGKDTSYSLSSEGSFTISCTQVKWNYFALKFTSGASYFGSIDVYGITAAPVTSLSISGDDIFDNSISISSTDFSEHTVSVAINSDATDKQVNIAQQSEYTLVTLGGLTSGHITCNASGVGFFTITGKAETSGTETIRISSNSTSTKYVDLVITAYNGRIAYHKLQFDTNGGSVPSFIDLVEDGESYTFVSAGIKTHYQFLHWKDHNSENTYSGGSSIKPSGDMSFTAVWKEDAKYAVTYKAGANGSGEFSDTDIYAGSYTLKQFTDLIGVSANSGYRFKNYTVGGVEKDGGDIITISGITEVTVNFEVRPQETTYDFEAKFSTYAKDWKNSYVEHLNLRGVDDIGGEFAANINMYKASKQTDASITTMPVFATKTASGSWTKVLDFTLQETGKEIDSITVTFKQWGSKVPDVSLFKGSNATGTPLDSGTIGTKNVLTASNVGGTDFAIGYCDKNTDSNVQAGLKSITITTKNPSSFGTLDHISIEQKPNQTVYHVGQTFSKEGLKVKAYDGPNEMTANSKDVTTDVILSLANGHEFVESDLSLTSVTVSYTETVTKSASFDISAYGLRAYKKANSISEGRYIIVDKDEDGMATLNGLCTPLDQIGDKNAAPVSNVDGLITTGEEYEVFIKNADDGKYTIQLKNGKYLTSPTSSSGIDSSIDEVALSLAYNAGHVEIKGLNNKFLGFDSSVGNRRFRFNQTNAGSTLQLYKLSSSDSAFEFAETFTSILFDKSSPVCDYNGNTNLDNLRIAWALLAEEFANLSNYDKELYKYGNADEHSELLIEVVIYQYEYIAGKYNTKLQSQDLSNYDFMQRNPLMVSGTNSLISTNNIQDNTWIIVIVGLVSLIALGGCLFIRRSKKINN